MTNEPLQINSAVHRLYGTAGAVDLVHTVRCKQVSTAIVVGHFLGGWGDEGATRNSDNA